HGESLYLFSGDGNTNLAGYSHSFDFGAAASGVSFGRYVNSVGEEQWPALTVPTFGASNSPPRVGPLVINEIMYHPAPGYDEFVEIYTMRGAAVPLFDLAFPTNHWRVNGLSYTLPDQVTLGAGQYLLLVNTEPLAFRTKYNIPSGVQILGPYTGTLQDSG